MRLLEVEDLTVRFGERRAVDNVSFVLERGETLALVGESGSGKSMTALSLLRLLPPAAMASGKIRLNNKNLTGVSERDLQRLRGGVAGMVFQEPMTSLNPLARVGKQVMEAMRLHRSIGPEAARARAVALLEEVGFADARRRLDAFPHQLSGGQRQRVMIAMALANDPALLIADEPTTALDVTIQAQILSLLVREKEARGLALLLITHDLSIVQRFADRVCVMKQGRIVESGDMATIFDHPRHPYTKALLNAEPGGAPPPLRNDAEVLIEAADLRVYFPIRRGVLRRTIGHVQAVDGITLKVHAGETVGLVGESGSGKSTTGFALLRLQDADGCIRFAGQDLSLLRKRQLRKLRAGMQIVFQDPFGSLSPRLTVGEIIAEGLSVHERHLSAEEKTKRVAEALDEVGLSAAIAGRYPHEFSGGQRQRIAIARAMVLKPRFVVLDEPTSSLDRSVQAQIVDLLRRLQQDHDLGYLFISHDLKVVKAMAHRVVVLRHGQVVEEGPAKKVLTRPRHPYTRALMAAAFMLEPDETGVVEN